MLYISNSPSKDLEFSLTTSIIISSQGFKINQKADSFNLVGETKNRSHWKHIYGCLLALASTWKTDIKFDFFNLEFSSVHMQGHNYAS